MKSNRNLIQFQVYLRPKQMEALNQLKFQIKFENEVKFPVSELIRDAVDQFILETGDDEYRKEYIQNKGW